MPHVGGGEITVPLVGVLADTRREHLVPAVEEADRHRAAAEVLERAPADDAKLVARRKLPAKPQAEWLVHLLKHHARAADVLMQVTAPCGSHSAARFPERALRLDEAHGAARLRHGEEFVDGLIGKNRQVGVSASGGHAAVAAQKHPEIAVADDIHQERWQVVHVANADVRLTGDRRERRAAGCRRTRRTM